MDDVMLIAMVFAIIGTPLILGGVIGSNIQKRRLRKLTHIQSKLSDKQKLPPRITSYLQADHQYNISLSDGTTLTDVKFIGISQSHGWDSPYLPFPLGPWLVVEKGNGKRTYVKPHSVRYYEEVGEEEHEDACKSIGHTC